MKIKTIRTYAEAIDRSPQFVRAAIRLKKVEAEKIGNQWMIPGEDVERFKNEPFQISRKEMDA